MEVLQVNRISKKFGSVHAVQDLSFSVEENCIYGLLGPNGAGKTTALRMIMNIIAPDSGDVTVLGNADLARATDQIGYLPEERGLYRKMKVGDLMLFLMSLKSVPKSTAKTEIDRWLDRLEISDWKNKKIEELSKGMQQKIQFICTIMHKPKILILDEPFGGLDPINTNLIKELMLEVKKQGTAIIFSTHVMDSAEKLCDRILLMNKGATVLSGKLSEIKKDYGRENVLLEFDGNDDFLRQSPQIKQFDSYGSYVEAQLVKGADTQELLGQALQAATIHKFEIKSPSLNDIFIEAVNQSNAGGAA